MNLFNYLMNKKGHKIVDNNHMLEYLLNNGEEPIIDEPMRLINGENFNVLVKNLNTTEATIETEDTTITKIIFDYWNKKYKSQFGDFSNGTDVCFYSNGNIRLFYDNTIVYVLSSYHINLYNGYAMFRNFTELVEINFDNFDTAECVTFELTFTGDGNLVTQTGMETFNTSNVTTMQNMFNGAGFNKIGQDNTCDINVSNWDTRKVTNMRHLFRFCKASFIDISNFLTPVCTSFYAMFANCPNLVTLNFENCDMGNIEGSNYLSHNASGITEMCPNLVNLKFGKNLGNGYNANYNEYMASINLSQNSLLTHDSLMSVINNIGTIPFSSTRIKIYLGDNYNKLNASEISIATNKNWNVTNQSRN